MLTTLLAAVAIAPPFQMPTLDTFDGKTWAGVQVGITTDSELKKMFKTEKGAFRPEAIVLDKGERGGTRVEAVMQGRGGKALVQGFRLSWNPPEAADRLTRGFPTAPILLYPRERYEDWAIAAYPDRGIALFVTHTERNPDVESALLCSPDALRAALRGYDDRRTDVVEYRDPYEGKPKVMEFGSVGVSYSVSGIKLLDERYDRDDFEREMQRLRGGGTLRYRYGARSGSIRLSVSCSYNAAKGGRVSVTARGEGSTHYGPVSADASNSREVGKGQTYLQYSSLASGVLRELEDKLEYLISRQGPPPIESFRYSAWSNVIEVACPRK